MSAPKRIQMSRRIPWRADNPDAVVVARPSKWGNPYKADGDNQEAVNLFRDMLRRAPKDHDGTTVFDDIRAELAGKDLACWCKLTDPCHADVLLEIANSEASR